MKESTIFYYQRRIKKLVPTDKQSEAQKDITALIVNCYMLFKNKRLKIRKPKKC